MQPFRSIIGIGIGMCLFGHGASIAATDETKGPPISEPSIATSLPTEVADPGGVRRALSSQGINLGAIYIGEALFNTQGGIERGAVYQGQLELSVDVDLEKSIGWRGLTFHAHGYDILGEGITVTKVGNLNALSGIEALKATRLLDIWLQQSLLNDAASIRIGQMAVDTEFMLAAGAAAFMSASFGWPTIASANLPNGGSAYPLSALAARVEVAPTDALTLRVAVFNDDPAGPCTVDPQICNAHGLDFKHSGDPYVIGESELHYGGSTSPILPGTLKLGGWVDFADFDDQRLESSGSTRSASFSSSTTCCRFSMRQTT